MSSRVSPPTKIVCIVIAVLMRSGGFDTASASMADEPRVERLMKYLRPVLERVGGAARIYHVGTCTPKGELSLFPRLTLQSPSKGAVGLTAVREIVQRDRRVAILKDRSDMIRIYIGGQPSAILQTRIRSLKLKPDQQYTYWFAIEAIEKTKEVEAARKPGEDAFEKLGGGQVVVSSILVPSPVKWLPHVPARMRDVTFDQALDSVAKAFGAVIIYDEWRGPHGALTSSIDFQPVVGYAP
jgi:hypothetical protein